MELFRDGATLHVVGQVDGRCTHELRDALQRQLQDEPGEIVLDLGEVDGVDLTALRMIAAISRQAWLEGHEVRVRSCPTLVRRLLHLSHLRALVRLDDDGGDGGAHFGRDTAGVPSHVNPATTRTHR